MLISSFSLSPRFLATLFLLAAPTLASGCTPAAQHPPASVWSRATFHDVTAELPCVPERTEQVTETDCGSLTTVLHTCGYEPGRVGFIVGEIDSAKCPWAKQEGGVPKLLTGGEIRRVLGKTYRDFAVKQLGPVDIKGQQGVELLLGDDERSVAWVRGFVTPKKNLVYMVVASYGSAPLPATDLRRFFDSVEIAERAAPPVPTAL